MEKAPGTQRAEAFRKRLAEVDLSRWEIVSSEATKAKVREIAKAEGLSAGVAAEALLGLGIEAYYSSPVGVAGGAGVATQASEQALPTVNFSGKASADIHGLNQMAAGAALGYSIGSAPSFASALGGLGTEALIVRSTPDTADHAAGLDLSGVLRKSALTQMPKTLASYSSRSSTPAEIARDQTTATESSALQGFFNRAKKRKPEGGGETE